MNITYLQEYYKSMLTEYYIWVLNEKKCQVLSDHLHKINIPIACRFFFAVFAMRAPNIQARTHRGSPDALPEISINSLICLCRLKPIQVPRT